MRRLTAIDLFSGCGGLTLGLKQAQFNVLAAIEADYFASEAYRQNHKEVKIANTDIRDISASRLIHELGLAPGQLDVLAGCPPCQGFSVLRTQNGAKSVDDQRNILIHQISRFARIFRPRTIMMENVPKLRDHPYFIKLCCDLQNMGYEITSAIKDAANYGVPQRRKRLIMVAGRGFKLTLAPDSPSLKTVREAIGKMPQAGASGDPLHDLPEKRADHVLRLIREIPKNGGSRSDLPPNRQLPCHQRQAGFHDVYGRLAWDGVAPTITSGCHNPSKGRFLHPEEDRALTLREAALLQSFPKNYNFPVEAGKEAIALMIGNALPPEFIRRHALEIRNAITAQRLD